VTPTAQLCIQHGGISADVVAVGAIERQSSVRIIWACTDCVRAFGIVPLADHDEDSGGQMIILRPWPPARQPQALSLPAGRLGCADCARHAARVLELQQRPDSPRLVSAARAYRVHVDRQHPC
jgi:hypothetical protein